MCTSKVTAAWMPNSTYKKTGIIEPFLTIKGITKNEQAAPIGVPHVATAVANPRSLAVNQVALIREGVE